MAEDDFEVAFDKQAVSDEIKFRSVDNSKMLSNLGYSTTKNAETKKQTITGTYSVSGLHKPAAKNLSLPLADDE